MKIRLSLTLALSIALSAGTTAQIPIQSNFQNVTPASPELAAFAKNVDIPMSYTSGTPQIAIPFFTVKSGGIEVPVSLSYNASGIRVSEVATWVGLGWNLSTGPSLTRLVRALADESEKGVMNAPQNRTINYLSRLPYWPSTGWDERALIELENKAGGLDFEPDIFNFSALGYSGTFYWNQDSAKFIIVPYQNVRLEYSGGGFVLTLPNGTQCFFNCPCETMSYSSSISIVDGVSQAPSSSSANAPSSWVVDLIRDPAGRTIDFEYETDFDVHDFGRGSETRGISLSNLEGAHIASYSYQKFNKPIIVSITGENGKIIFNRSDAVRQDVFNVSRSLESITIQNLSNQELKSFVFDYGYWTAEETILLPNLQNYVEVAKKRMYLKSVTEKNISTGVNLPPWEFSYDSTALPNRLSNKQDYWGYFNGKEQRDHLLMPRFPKKLRSPMFISTELPDGYIPGADRSIDTRKAQAGILTKIKYPTGGTTRYYYESNDAIVNMYYRDYGGIERPDIIYRNFLFSTTSVPGNAGMQNGYLMDTFRVQSPQTKVAFAISLPQPCNNEYDHQMCAYTIKIKSLPDSSINITRRQTGTVYYHLPSSLYKIELFYTGSDYPNFTVNMEWGEVTDTMNFKIGGLRVYKIVSEDNTGNTISRSFSYRWPGDSSRYSSGLLAGLPAHINYEYNGPGNISSIVRFHYVSNSATPLTSDGQTARYMFVTEYYDSAKTSFKNEYTFLCDFPTISVGPAENAPPLQRSWMNNLLLRKRSFEKTSDGFRPLTDEQTFYEPLKTLSWLGGLHGIQVRPYRLETAWHLPVKTSSTVYSYHESEKTSTTTSFNSYNDRYQLSKTTTSNSQGQLIENKVWYPNDFNNVPGFNLAALRANYLIDLPVKQESCVDGRIRSGSAVAYNEVGLPKNIYSYENAEMKDTLLHNRDIILRDDYQLKTTVNYDAAYNVTEVFASNNAPVSYIWENDLLQTGARLNNLPVAMVVNAVTSDIAYTSFEAATHGGWDYAGTGLPDPSAPTGEISFWLGTPITKSGLNSSLQYIVSYWSKNGPFSVTGSTALRTGRSVDGWTLYIHEIKGITTVSVAGSGLIDELRLHPKNAAMTSFTYKRGVGVITQCDPNNRVTYYLYDGIGRLKMVKDQDKNIVKLADYQYQSPSPF